MDGYQIQKRPKLEENKDKLKLKKLNDTYNVIHPSQVSLAADLLLVQKTDDEKDTVIPVHREFIMAAIPYFAKQYNEDGIWREGKLRDHEQYYVSNLPQTVSADSAVAYIKNLYEDEYNPFSVENCLDILELADYWCDEFMKTECLKFIADAMTDDLFRRIFKNSRLHSCVEKIVDEYVTRERSLRCGICENNRFHFFLPKTTESVVLENSNRAAFAVGVPTQSNAWALFTTNTIPRMPLNYELRVKFKLNNIPANTFVGIVDEAVDSNDENIWQILEPSFFCGFRMNKFILTECEEEKSKNHTLVETLSGNGSCGYELLSIPIVNNTKPFEKFLSTDEFTLVLSRSELKLETDRGFECSLGVKRSFQRSKYRIAVQIGALESHKGTGFEFLPNFDHICEQ